ncbi:hypothetical protein V2H45_09020 [Tumidithrix elongata RA019]|uniref:Uncharacterized protein n=1 Tax=Tumidithrix elongata BACA0141 TaxID=2716417 RepID=A0AAW9PYB7_9CYAN|nr:hypothetical protein [Tumidithrix elongata RA019]
MPSSRDIAEISILENFEVVKFKDIEFAGENCTIKEFIEKRMKIVLGKESLRIQSTVEEILKDLKNEENQLNALATNPLMLAMICIEYAAYSENQSRKSKGLSSTWHIVQRAVKIWIEEWNREFWKSQKENDNNPISIIFIYELLEYIACQTIEEEVLNISRSRLIKYIRNFVKKYYEWSDNMRIDRLAQLIFQFLKDTYGFTLISEDDIYSFPHTIFRDFFAIRYIYNNSQDLDEFKKDVAKNISKWQTIINKADNFPKEFC